MSGGGRRYAKVRPSRSPLIDEASPSDSRHQVAALSSAAPTLESNMWVSFGSFPPVPLLPANMENFGSANPYPRQIFGSSSTLIEAREKVCNQTNILPDSRADCQRPVSGETRTVSKTPKHVSQMFSLLHGNSELQAAVASIAKDKRVFEAVMKNEMVAEFCKNLPPNLASAKSAAVNEFPEVSSPPSQESEKTCEVSFFSKIVSNVKIKVSEKVSNISDFLQKSSGNSSSMFAMPTVRTAEALHPDKASYFALGIAVILLVLLMT